MTPTHAITIERLAERPVTPADLKSIVDIFFASSSRTSFADTVERQAFLERWLGRYLSYELKHVFVARSGQEIVGYLAGALDDPAGNPRYKDVPYIQDFAKLSARYPAHLHINLAPSFRGAGIGTELIEAFAAHVAAARVPGVHVVTGEGLRNVGFYERAGFAKLGRAKVASNADDKYVVFLGRSVLDLN